MITKEDILKSRNIITNLINEGIIRKPEQGLSNFFLNKAENSLLTARGLFELSKNHAVKRELNLPAGFEDYTWIINSAYYTMFYAATSLLAHFGYRIKAEQGIHILTFHALVYYFLDNDNKLTKYLLENYQEEEKNAEAVLQMAEDRAKSIIENVKQGL